MTVESSVFEQASLFLDEISTGVLLLEDTNKIIYASKWFLSAAKRRKKDVVGLTLEEAFHGSIKGRLSSAISDAFTAKRSTLLSSKLNKCLFPLRNLDGSEMLQRVTIKPFFVNDGVSRCLVQVEDVTDSFQREKSLKEKRNQVESDKAHLNAVLQSSAEGIVTLDEDGVIDTFNIMAEKLFGYDADAIIGKNISSLISEVDNETQADVTKSAFPYALRFINKPQELVARHNSGTTFPIELNIAKVEDPKRNLFVGIMHDISARKTAEKELAEKAKELNFQKKALDEHAIVSITNVKGVITYANDKFCEISGYSREELLGEKHSILKSDEHTQEFFKDMWRTFSNGEAWHGDIKNKNKNDEYYWVKSTIVPFLDEDGKPVQYIAIRTEITEQILAERNAEKANMAKSDFLSSMSHELRTPMNAIIGFSQILNSNKKEPLSPGQEKCVSHILKGGKHLLELINEVLDLAKIESGDFNLDKEYVFPSDIFRDCLELLRGLADERGITLSGKKESNHGIMADSFRFKQVMINLLSNAIKYNKDGGTVTFGCNDQPNGIVRIFISDTGMGISEENINNLFKPFERFHAMELEIEGTGIGLTISKRLIETMGGTISCESTLGEGTTFYVDFEKADEKTSPVTLEKTQDVQPQDFDETTGTILYIEDNKNNAELMKLIIGRIEGLHLISAATGELGLDLAQSIEPNLIISDILLPGIDGFEVLARLKKHEKTKDIPILGLSANAMPHDIEKAKQAGFEHYLTKPINVVEITSVIKNLLNQD